MLLAQLNAVDPRTLADILIVAVVFISLGLAARTAFRRSDHRREIAPQPLEVKPAQEFVGAGQCLARHENLERRLSALEQGLLALRREMREDRAALTRQMLEEIGRVHARVNESEQRLGQNMRILPGEIVALLRNTGAIHPRE